MNITIQVKEHKYPIGWEWLHEVPIEDWQWLIDILATVTDNVTTYEYATFINENGTISENRQDWVLRNNKSILAYNYVNHVNTKELAEFMDKDQGYKGGIQQYGYYIAAKTLGIKSEDEYRDNYKKICNICNE